MGGFSLRIIARNESDLEFTAKIVLFIRIVPVLENITSSKSSVRGFDNAKALIEIASLLTAIHPRES